MKKCLLLLFALAFVGCESGNALQKIDEGVLDKEIKWRLDSLAAYKKLQESKTIDCEGIHKSIQDLILVSKDVENTKASVNLANTYLDELAQNYKLNSSMLVYLTNEMDSKQISYLLKQNELSILNAIMLQKLNIIVPLKAVQ